MIDDIAWHEVAALRTSRLIEMIATTPLRAWLLDAGPSGLSSGSRPLRDNAKFARRQVPQIFFYPLGFRTASSMTAPKVASFSIPIAMSTA
jgi:hypothetical protein